jgi:hypothetical protein
MQEQRDEETDVDVVVARTSEQGRAFLILLPCF